MNPQQLPLEPLIAPDPVSWWPLAPIWWVLFTLIILTILLIVILRLRKKRTADKPLPLSTAIDMRRQAALAELATIEKPYGQAAGLWLQQLNSLLKRLCNTTYPTENAKVLMGQAWLNFLDSKCPSAQIKQFTVLVEGEYQENYHIDNTTIDALHSTLEKWITHHV